jgi:UDP-galactopyranose mutase
MVVMEAEEKYKKFLNEIMAAKVWGRMFEPVPRKVFARVPFVLLLDRIESIDHFIP